MPNQIEIMASSGGGGLGLHEVVQVPLVVLLVLLLLLLSSLSSSCYVTEGGKFVAGDKT